MDAHTDGGRPTEDTVVSLSGAYKVYELGEPVPVLDDVSLKVPRGSYTSIMGPSGSGKSTLLNLIGCLDTPTAGEIRIDGTNVTKLSDSERANIRGEKIGFVFQTFNLMPRLTALENVAMPLSFRNVPREERTERAESLLADVGLADRVDHKPTELSGGQRQRVSIARALVNDPAIILADEPTGSLDSETSRQIMHLFEELYQRGNTILMVTHERDIAEHAERIVHVLDGEIERVEELRDQRRIPSVDETEPVQNPGEEATEGEAWTS
ncbi:ABC transporter ATP-binding protein [Haloprofundus salinisoli]|uniref:ABC transporter ATP-binding protein n=1 Tax=Haloprofundus salinisoli TaxID=2876193 RepID=UPI001CCF8AF0|nr:ABC transporter ATP-binding protein [Haloprofundus salinisoli]